MEGLSQNIIRVVLGAPDRLLSTAGSLVVEGTTSLHDIATKYAAGSKQLLGGKKAPSHKKVFKAYTKVISAMVELHAAVLDCADIGYFNPEGQPPPPPDVGHHALVALVPASADHAAGLVVASPPAWPTHVPVVDNLILPNGLSRVPSWSDLAWAIQAQWLRLSLWLRVFLYDLVVFGPGIVHTWAVLAGTIFFMACFIKPRLLFSTLLAAGQATPSYVGFFTADVSDWWWPKPATQQMVVGYPMNTSTLPPGADAPSTVATTVSGLVGVVGLAIYAHFAF